MGLGLSLEGRGLGLDGLGPPHARVRQVPKAIGVLRSTLFGDLLAGANTGLALARQGGHQVLGRLLRVRALAQPEVAPGPDLAIILNVVGDGFAVTQLGAVVGQALLVAVRKALLGEGAVFSVLDLGQIVGTGHRLARGGGADGDVLDRLFGVLLKLPAPHLHGSAA